MEKTAIEFSGSIAGLVISLIIGLLLGGGGVLLVMDHRERPEKESIKKPLYWVAPMDSSYRRDGPGKSPMGMDLVPVYGQEGEETDSPGIVRISPDVVNNLGVRTDIAHAMPMKTVINTVGYVQYDEDQLVHIHPRVEGWIEKLYIKAAGDPVVEGMPLYDIYSPVLVNAQDELLLALERNNRELISSTENRMRALKIPQSLIDRVKRTRKVVQTVTIYAPQDGVVDNLTVREGFFIQPGNTVMSIGALDEVWVKAEVFERQANRVKKGDRVTMRLDFLPSRVWQGVVDYVYPTLDPATRTIPVRMRFANLDHALKPNMYAEVSIHGQDSKPTLVIPREALIRTGTSDRVVLAFDAGRFKSVDVSVGRLDDHRVEILGGLNAGDRVVVSAQFLLDSESSITSDFRRISHGRDTERSVWATGKVKSVMPGHGMLTITHQPIKSWDWPEMTMDFLVVDTVDLGSVKKGMEIELEITQNNTGEYRITSIRPHSDETKLPVDHSQHTMSGHADMDHSMHGHSQHGAAEKPDAKEEEDGVNKTQENGEQK